MEEFTPEELAEYTIITKLGSPYPIGMVCMWYATNRIGERKLLEERIFYFHELNNPPDKPFHHGGLFKYSDDTKEIAKKLKNFEKDILTDAARKLVNSNLK